MSKRMSLVDATSRRKEDFVRAAAAPEAAPWEDPAVVEQPVVAAQAVRAIRPVPMIVDEVPRKKTTFNLDASLHRKLKLTAVRHDREMVEIVEEAISNHLRTIERAAGE